MRSVCYQRWWPSLVHSQGTPSRTLIGFSCFIAYENMGVDLKFHVSNIFFCLHAFGNVGGH